MKQLLSYKTIRVLNIAEALVVKNRPITHEQIQVQNDCSKKTVQDDLHYLKTQWGHILDFTMHSNSITTDSNNIYDLLLLKSYLFQGEIKIQFLLNLFLNPNLNIPEHSDMINYSESHLRRQIEPLNNYLRTFESAIVMDTKSKGYYIHSENETLTTFMISQVAKVSHNKELFNSLNTESFDVLNKAFKKPFEFVPDEEKQDMDIFFRAILVRQEQGFNCEEDILKLQSEHANLLNKSKLFNQAIDKYSQKFNRVFGDKERETLKDIFISIALKTKLAPMEIDNYMNRFTYFYESLKKENPLTTKSFETIVQEIKENHRIDYTSYVYELAFFFYTHIQGLRSYKTLKIAVDSDLGKYHARSLITSLIKHFPMHHFELYDPKNKFDLLICTRNNFHDSDKSKIIKVSDYINLRDIDIIYRHIYLDTQK